LNQKEMLRGVSRTFALSIEQLPPVLCDAMSVSYLLLRVSDLLEDHDTLPPERKSELLRLWARVLDEDVPVEDLTSQITDLDSDDPEVYVAQHAGRVLEMLAALPADLQTAIIARVAKTSRGMARWQDHGPYVADEAEMDDYMHEVAGRVGYLTTDVFSWSSAAIRAKRDTLMPLSRECGLALQTVNVIRGMRKDYERGWVFVPQVFYERFGLTRDSLFDHANLDRSMQVVALLADKADRHLENGMHYITAFPRRYHRIRLACAWPLLFAARTLAISRNNPAVLISEAKMTRAEVHAIVRQTTLFGWSNHWMMYYYGRLTRPPVLPASSAPPPAPPSALPSSAA
jgi:farnesyl-diphosphate farnesyltransferase